MEEHQPRVRPAAVAGRFYPAEPERLRAAVEQLLRAAGSAAVRPKALIAPHAGYVYSGPIAAESFATLRGASGIKRVVVIGPAHFVAVRGIAVPGAEAFETPFGSVAVDREGLAALHDLPFVSTADAPHAPEHALEVELPFLQALMGAFTLVPLLVGAARPKDVAESLNRVWGGPETLIVVRSDLSHYHAYDAACRIDAETADAIDGCDWRRLSADRACGYLAVAGLLIEAARRGLTRHRLALANSGDTAGPRDGVVGYGAWAFDEGEAT